MEFIELAELCDKGSSNLAQKDLVFDSGIYPVYGAPGEITKVDFFHQSKPYLGLIKDGAGVGRVMQLPANSSVIGTIQYIFPKENVDLKYLYYLIKYLDLGKSNTGATIPHIYFKDYKKRKVKVREYGEQKHIGQILELIDSHLSAYKNVLDQYDLLIKSRFVDLFGDIELNEKKWKKIKFGELIKSANNGLARRGNDKAGNIVLRLIELQENLINYSDPNRILLTDDEKKRYRLLEGDLLFARVNGNPKNVGRCATFHEYEEQVYHNDHIIRTSCDKSRLDSVFAAYLFNIEYGKNRISRKIKTSAGQYTINQEGLKSIEIILPPIVIQYSFAEFIKQINKLKSDVQKSIDETQLLMDSLMQEYFG